MKRKCIREFLNIGLMKKCTNAGMKDTARDHDTEQLRRPADMHRAACSGPPSPAGPLTPFPIQHSLRHLGQPHPALLCLRPPSPLFSSLGPGTLLMLTALTAPKPHTCPNACPCHPLEFWERAFVLLACIEWEGLGSGTWVWTRLCHMASLCLCLLVCSVRLTKSWTHSRAQAQHTERAQ